MSIFKRTITTVTCRMCSRPMRMLTGQENLCYACRCDIRFAAKHPEPVGYYGDGSPIWPADSAQQHGLEDWR